MPWKDYILEQFESAIPLGEYDESQYYGPYNTLLSKSFPGSEHYLVVPQYKRPRRPESVDFTTIFLIQQRQHPVFFVEVKAAGHIRNDSSCADTDQQMRQWVYALRNDIEIPILHGLCAIGTKLCFYEYTKDTQELEPVPIPDHATRIVDLAPRDHWDFDVLTPKGERKFRGVIGDIKRMCEQIGQGWPSYLIVFY